MLGNLSYVEKFRISKMKLDFQNMDWEFKSLGDYFNVLFVFMPHFITGILLLQLKYLVVNKAKST